MKSAAAIPDMNQASMACWAALRDAILNIFLDGGWLLAMIRNWNMARKDWSHLCKLLRAAENLIRHLLTVWAFADPDLGFRKTKSRFPLDLSLHLAFRRVRFLLSRGARSVRASGAAQAYQTRETAPVFGCAQRLQSLLHIIAHPARYKERLRRRALSRHRNAADLQTEIYRARCLLLRHRAERAAKKPQQSRPFEARLNLTPEALAARRRFFASG